MKKDLNQYVQIAAKREFDWRKNSCIHFVANFHGCLEMVPENTVEIYRRPDASEVIARMIDAAGFVRTFDYVPGNIVAVRHPDGLVWGLRWDFNYFVFQSVKGVIFQALPFDAVVHEWRAP